MNKSLITNLAAASICLAGTLLPQSEWQRIALYAGLFALSGALTNWLAVHMLFERVPGLYGSGVIQARFTQFKESIRQLVMDNFFTEENFRRFADVALRDQITAEAALDRIDLDELFDGFLDVIAKSKYGGMLAMFGGMRALEPLRAPFKEKFEAKVVSIIDDIQKTPPEMGFKALKPQIESMVVGRLEQLQPLDAKEIAEKIMREHLGWLVVWGGIFGGIIGVASSFLI